MADATARQIGAGEGPGSASLAKSDGWSEMFLGPGKCNAIRLRVQRYSAQS